MAYEIDINIHDLTADGTGISGLNTEQKIDAEREKAAKNLGKYIAAQTITPFVGNIKQQVTQNIQIVTGNSELQQRVNMGLTTVQFGINTYKNAKAGAILGQAVGIGGLAGTAIGLALTAIETTMSIEFERLRLRLQAQMENYQLQQTRSRFGSAYNRTREGV